MKKIIMTLAMCLMLVGSEAIAQKTSNNRVSFAQRLTSLERALSQAIILTDQPCSALGEGWRHYGAISGRFPLASGSGVDEREETMEFDIGSQGGEYRHVLSVAEMPRHRHAYHDRSMDGLPNRVDDHNNRADEPRDTRRQTEVSGGNEPHNNMPPYKVVNFCWNR